LGFLELLRHAQFAPETRPGDFLACAIARLYWRRFSARGRKLVEAIETRAEDYTIPDVNSEELLDILDGDIRRMPRFIREDLSLLTLLFCGQFQDVSDAVRDEPPPGRLFPEWERIVRDVYPNPFRPVAFDPSWLTDTVVSLARGMYDSRDFSPMPVLADALQDAGCDHPDVLAHCRDPQAPHVRGCWVVDLVLGKS
jgi:hypothetical protein